MVYNNQEEAKKKCANTHRHTRVQKAPSHSGINVWMRCKSTYTRAHKTKDSYKFYEETNILFFSLQKEVSLMLHWRYWLNGLAMAKKSPIEFAESSGCFGVRLKGKRASQRISHRTNEQTKAKKERWVSLHCSYTVVSNLLIEKKAGTERDQLWVIKTNDERKTRSWRRQRDQLYALRYQLI